VSMGQSLAILKGLMSINSKDMGGMELEDQAAVNGELMDEVVLNALGMLMQERATELSGIVLGSISST